MASAFVILSAPNYLPDRISGLGLPAYVLILWNTTFSIQSGDAVEMGGGGKNGVAALSNIGWIRITVSDAFSKQSALYLIVFQ